MKFLTTVTGSYPRKDVQKDTLRKSSVNDEEALEMIKWAVKEQSDLGLDIITDGEGYRENMYWFYQLRTDGVDAENKKYKHFSTGGSMDKVDLSKTHGTKGFGIECAVIKDEIKNLDTKLATKWKTARKNTPRHIEVKQTITENFLYFKNVKNTNKELIDTKNKNNINHPFAFVIFNSDIFFKLNNSLFISFSSNALVDLFNINI